MRRMAGTVLPYSTTPRKGRMNGKLFFRAKIK
jgi:hypothetical protein